MRVCRHPTACAWGGILLRMRLGGWSVVAMYPWWDAKGGVWQPLALALATGLA